MPLKKSANRWKEDKEASCCADCRESFGLFRRRHHCRQCGDIFCAPCSNQQRIVPIVHPLEKQRVCMKCFNMSTGDAGSAVIVAVVSPLKPPQVANSTQTNHTGTDSASATLSSPAQCFEQPGQQVPQGESLPPPAGGLDELHETTASPPHNIDALDVPHADYDSDDGHTGTPPSILPIYNDGPETAPEVAGTLAFVAQLADKHQQNALSDGYNLPVLMFAKEGVQVPVNVSVSEKDTVENVIERLAPKFLELQGPSFRRPTSRDTTEFMASLYCHNEFGTEIPRQVKAVDLCSQSERVVMTTRGLQVPVSTSGRSLSVHSFFNKSERSDDAGI